MAEVLVDGRAIAEGAAPGGLDGAGRIDVRTVSVAEAVARIAEECARKAGAIRARVDALANEVLRVAWPQAGAACAGLGGELGRLAEDAGGLATHAGSGSAMAQALGGLGDSVDRWVDAVQAQDAAAVCLRLHHEMGPALGALEEAARRLAGGGPAS